MRELVKVIRSYMMEKGIEGQVSSKGDLIVINNLNLFYSASDIASLATGKEFTYMGYSITKLA